MKRRGERERLVVELEGLRNFLGGHRNIGDRERDGRPGRTPGVRLEITGLRIVQLALTARNETAEKRELGKTRLAF